MEVLKQQTYQSTHQVSHNEGSELYKALVGMRSGRSSSSSTHSRHIPSPSDRDTRRYVVPSSGKSFHQPETVVVSRAVVHDDTRLGGYSLSIPDTGDDDSSPHIDVVPTGALEASGGFYYEASIPVHPTYSTVIPQRMRKGEVIVTREPPLSTSSSFKLKDSSREKQLEMGEPEVHTVTIERVSAGHPDVLQQQSCSPENTVIIKSSSSPPLLCSSSRTRSSPLLPTLVSHSTKSFDVSYDYGSEHRSLNYEHMEQSRTSCGSPIVVNMPEDEQMHFQEESYYNSEYHQSSVLRRSYSDEGRYNVSDDAPAIVAEEIFVPRESVATCIPLDLSTKSPKSENTIDSQFSSCSSFANRTEYSPASETETEVKPAEMSVNETNVPTTSAAGAPKMSLLQLADVVSYIIENDPQSRETFNCSSASSPSSVCDSNSSHSTSSEDKNHLMNDDASDFSDSQEYLPVSPEPTMDGCLIKCEIGDSFRPNEGIVLNSNIADSQFSSTGSDYGEYYADQDASEADDLAYKHELDHENGLDYEMMEDLPEDRQAAATAAASSFFNNKNYNPNRGAGPFMPARYRMHRRGESTAQQQQNAIDGKRRLRLAKAEYESMSEEDRRVRHRVLDNQRSKQYRERRRKMVTSLQSQIGTLEDSNKTLKDFAATLEKRRYIMRKAISCCFDTTAQFPPEINLSATSAFVKAEC